MLRATWLCTTSFPACTCAPTRRPRISNNGNAYAVDFKRKCLCSMDFKQRKCWVGGVLCTPFSGVLFTWPGCTSPSPHLAGIAVVGLDSSCSARSLPPSTASFLFWLGDSIQALSEAWGFYSVILFAHQNIFILCSILDSLDLSFRGRNEDTKINKRMEITKQLDNCMIAMAVENSPVWFGKKMSKEVVDEFYRPILKESKGPNEYLR